MELEQFMAGMAERFTQLPEEDKDRIRAFKQTEEAQLISYVLGPELTAVIERLGPPQAQQQQQVVAPQPEVQQPQAPKRRGLGMRP
jgi:hypothetical protein